MSAPDLRLIVITDRDAAGGRELYSIVGECLEAGAPAIQLRDKNATARELYETALEFRRLTSLHHALLFLNDRFDIAIAVNADGVHLGPDDLGVEAVRRVTSDLLVGASTDDALRAAGLVRAGADYIGCGAVFGTTSKKDLGDEKIGIDRLGEVCRAVSVPVVAIGGITPANTPAALAVGASGVAVIRSVMADPEPGTVVSAILATFRPPFRQPV